MPSHARSSSRNSRWDRSPVVNDDGDPRLVRLTERDIDVFKVLTHYRYLPGDDLHAFVGGSLNAVLRRLSLLSRKPNCYLARPHHQRESADANYRRLVYALDERAWDVLGERGHSAQRRAPQRHFAHELMVCRITASFELGARADQTIRLITWAEILASENTPAATRAASAPASIPVRFSLHDRDLSLNLTADGWPFGIESNRAGQRSYFFFPGIEADCATEPIEPSDIDRSSILKKFAAYRAIATQEIFRTHFGFPNFFVPIVTTTTGRMESMMQLLDRMTGGRGSKMFLFTTYPAFNSFEKPPPAGGHMLTRNWQRVGYPPFRLTD